MISPGYDSRSLTRKWWAIRGEAMAGLAVLVVSLLVGSVASVATLVAGLAVLIVSPLVESVGAPPGASDRCSTAKSACTDTNSSGLGGRR